MGYIWYTEAFGCVGYLDKKLKEIKRPTEVSSEKELDILNCMYLIIFRYQSFLTHFITFLKHWVIKRLLKWRLPAVVITCLETQHWIIQKGTICY